MRARSGPRSCCCATASSTRTPRAHGLSVTAPWLRAQDLGAGAQATLLDYLGAIDTLELRRDQLEATISELVPGSPYAQTVARLRCLRGIDTLSAVELAVP
jgi:hypothetical protein